MKKLILITGIFLASLSACEQRDEIPEKLIGIWAQRSEEIEKTGLDFYPIIIFAADNSMNVRIIRKGNIRSILSGPYRFDSKTNTIRTRIRFEEVFKPDVGISYFKVLG